MNIRFEYLYKDAGNFKQWGDIILSNPNNINIDSAILMIEQVLIDRAYFFADKAKVSNLFFSEYIKGTDHSWHEFHTLSLTDEKPNDPQDRSIEDFIESLRYASAISISDIKESDIYLIREGIDIIVEIAIEIKIEAILRNKVNKLI